MTDYSKLEQWMETTYVFDFDMLKSKNDYEQKKDEIFRDHKLTVYGQPEVILKGPKRQGQIVLGRYFTGRRGEPLSNTKASETWERLIEEEKTKQKSRASIIENIRKINEELKIPIPENFGPFTQKDLEETYSDLQNRKIKAETKQKQNLQDTERYIRELIEEIPQDPQDFMNKIKNMVEDIRPLQQTQRETYKKEILTKARTLPFDNKTLTQIRLQTSRNITRAETLDIRRTRGLELTGEDLRRIGIRSTNRLIEQFGLLPEEAQQIIKRKEYTP